ncbi:MAG TPA: monovalent cation/H(+) antiporter subunit G, partial [Candidatus Limnocylindria bacterium]|nr:monovalent cation/H(+) antiporter subunit G [Candidatus Limnocylindria bacterium]
MLEWLRFALSAALMTAGLFTLLVAVIGVYKFDYVLNRMHAAATADTLGILFCLLSLMVSAPDAWTVAKLALIVVFLWVASP